ncbi:hypothetical protein CY35_11G087000 [Sphagnum magellanicum]|nr:hypothetical protein CY35_11G087000 [Sphagnum magellanicum]KAH9548431.1 hypothetical protein CY35_11G087000 [Sphagnum magellanicum]
MGSTHSCLHRPPGGLSGHEELRAKHRFRKVTGKEHLHLTQEKFSELLGPSPCTEGLFKYVDADGDGTISFDEIHKEITAFRAMKSPEAKLRDAMVVACGQALPQTQVEQLVSSTMDMFDTDKDGFLNFSEFSTLMVTSGLELS